MLRTESDMQKWLSEKGSPSDWQMVRIIKVVPTFSVLKIETQARLMELYSGIVSFCPAALDKPLDRCETWESNAHLGNVFSAILIESTNRVESLSGIHSESSEGSNDRGHYGKKHVFRLLHGEHINQVIVWNGENKVYGVQFVTTRGRVSPHYGGNDGVPAIMNSSESVLTGLIGVGRPFDGIAHLQTVWRRDIFHNGHESFTKYAAYFGGNAGIPFNDWSVVGYLSSTRISSIEANCGNDINGIQLNYATLCFGQATAVEGIYHGKVIGEKRLIALESGENIIAVHGSHDGTGITSLVFTTDKGRSVDFSGMGQGTTFACQPKTSDGKPMRLAFIVGKCREKLNGVLLIWASA